MASIVKCLFFILFVIGCSSPRPDLFGQVASSPDPTSPPDGGTDTGDGGTAYDGGGGGTPDGGTDDTGTDTGDGGQAVDGPCPPGMVLIPAASGISLGEWDPSFLVNEGGQPYQYALPSGFPVDLSAFCVDKFPFPGEGEDWVTETPYFEQMEALEAKIAEGGRRLCTVPELLYAASGATNWRFATHPSERVEGDCEDDDQSPQPIGSYPSCISQLGVADFNVRSSWAKVPASLEEYLRGVMGGAEVLLFGVYGGTSRDGTFYAPTNFSLHFHGEGLMEQGGYGDDDLRVCADPEGVSEEQEARWEELKEEFLAGGSSYRAWL